MHRRLVSGLFVCLAAAGFARGQVAPPPPPPDPNVPPSNLSPNEFVDPRRPVTLPPWFDDPNAARSQDAKALEVLKAGIKALGGDQAILGRKTIYIKRKVINHEYPDPREGTVTLWFKRPNLLRKEIAYPQQKHVEAYDGRRAWFDSGAGPRWRGDVLTAAILNGIAELDLPANFLDAELTYFNISKEVPGKLTHVVKARKNGYTRELMFDVNTSLLEVMGEYENPWGATDKMTTYERYRPIDGVMVPHRVMNYRSSTLISETEIVEIRFNEPLEDTLFAYPSASGAPAP